MPDQGQLFPGEPMKPWQGGKPYPPLGVGFDRGSDTSEAAAESVRPSIAGLRAYVLRLFDGRTWTCDEIEVSTGLRHQTASARLRELVLLNKIRDTGTRRPTRSGRGAAVYEVCCP